MLENSTYNDISEFLEISLNRLKLKLPNANSSFIPVELQIPFENESVFSARRIGLYTVEHLFLTFREKTGMNTELTELCIKYNFFHIYSNWRWW